MLPANGSFVTRENSRHHAVAYAPGSREFDRNRLTPRVRTALGCAALETVLEIRNLHLTRGDTSILENVSWQVACGEHWVILGANGSGKTSLLSALTAYVTPSSGTIELLGARYGGSDWRELRKHLGLVSSSVRQLMPENETALTTVISGKYAMIGYHGRTTAADRQQGIAILHSTESAQLATRPWQVLSQGERQRVLIGRALMAEPKLLILDEPCAGLDPVARENFLQFVQRLGSRRGSPALVLVTHHVDEIMPVFTHALLLKGGRLVSSGTKADILTAANLQRTFGRNVALSETGGRYTLTVESLGQNVI
jgi:iron complex transport system ATP-binding protein